MILTLSKKKYVLILKVLSCS